MTINFKTASLATSREKEAYVQMTTFNRKVELAKDGAEILSWKSKQPIDVGDHKIEKLQCASGYSQKTSQFSFSCGEIRYPTLEAPIYWRGTDKKIAEVRYGDIDKDGDIDITVKLTNGAIYVFHNLSK